MGQSKKQLEDRSAEFQSTLAKAVAPEDVRPGDYLAVLRVVFELPSFLWCVDASTLPHREPVRVPFTPERGGIPLKVKAVCLPFVLVKLPFGSTQSLDVRRYHLARLDESYATRAWKVFKKSRLRTMRDWLEA